MKITMEKKSVLKFRDLKPGDTFVILDMSEPDVFMKLQSNDCYDLGPNSIENFLEGNMESCELDNYNVNCLSLNSTTLFFFEPSDDVVKVDAELIVHN